MRAVGRRTPGGIDEDIIAVVVGGDSVEHLLRRMNDLERVEVLIGPQGTLYGAGTLAGALRYIPNRPNADAFEAQIRGDVYDLEQSR